MTKALSHSHPFSIAFFADSLALLKPRITLLALITAAAGMYLAPGTMNVFQVIMALVGLGLLVSGAGALNMFLERDVDAAMLRTQTRPLPGKRLSPEYGLGLGSIMVGLAIPWLVYFINPLTGVIGLGSLLIYVAIYTPLKKRTPWALWVGAIPGAAPPLLGWAAATGTLSPVAWVLFGIIFFWQIPHFLAIGLFREEEYHQAGLRLFPRGQNPKILRLRMLIYSIFLVPVSFALIPLGVKGLLYLITAILLNAAMIISVLLGFSKMEEKRWARIVFFTSLLYLTLLFAVLFWEGKA